MDKEAIQFDVTHEEWRVTGSYADEDNITIYRNGEHYRTFTYPGYKIWNIAAHAEELVWSLEAGERSAAGARYFVADDGGDVDPRPLSGRVSSRCADGCAAFPARPCHESEGYCYYGYDETYNGTWD